MSHSMGLAAPPAMSNTGSPCISVKWVNAISPHTFRPCLPFFLVHGIWKFVIDLIHGMACCTWPYHLSRRQRRTDVMSSMPSLNLSVLNFHNDTNVVTHRSIILPQLCWIDRFPYHDWTSPFNSLAPGRLRYHLKLKFWILFYWLVSSHCLRIMPWGECQGTSLMISQHWFR